MRHSPFILAAGIHLLLSALLAPHFGQADTQVPERTALAGVTFAPDSAVLTKSAVGYLKPLLAELRADPRLRIVVEAYASASGTAEADLKLSRNRALSVHNWLVAQGIDASRIGTAALGSAGPAATVENGENSDRIDITKTRALYPVAVFPEAEYRFEPVTDGQEVQHDFVVRNTGTAELVVKEVRTG